MRWLIDGYNVIRRDPDLRAAEARSLEAGRRALAAVVADVARRTGDHVVIVFDGARVRGVVPSRGQVEIVFSRPPETADDVLVRLARTLRDGAIVVTSDRTVRDASRRAGATVLTTEEFVGALEEAPAPGDDEDDGDAPPSKRGNPRRPSRDERAAARALRRLRGR